MSAAVIKSYARSIQRGKRAIEQVPENLRAAVEEELGKEV